MLWAPVCDLDILFVFSGEPEGQLVATCWTGTNSFLLLHVSSRLSGHTTARKQMRARG